MSNSDLNRLSEVSIRGRVAFSLCCLHTLNKHFNYDKLDWGFVLDKLWGYTNVQWLDDWNEEIPEYLPTVIKEYDNYVEKNFNHLTIDGFNFLKDLYSKINEDVEEMIDCIYYVGTIELYGQVQKKSKSLENVKEVIDIMKKNGLDIPDVGRFAKYGFDTGGDGWHGWGRHFDRTEIVC